MPVRGLRNFRLFSAVAIEDRAFPHRSHCAKEWELQAGWPIYGLADLWNVSGVSNEFRRRMTWTIRPSQQYRLLWP